MIFSGLQCHFVLNTSVNSIFVNFVTQSGAAHVMNKFYNICYAVGLFRQLCAKNYFMSEKYIEDMQKISGN